MKKILLSALVLSMSSGLFAQFTKGSLAFTGLIGLNGGTNKTQNTNNTIGGTTTVNDQKTKGYNFIPAVSYFVTDKIEVGIALGLTKSTTISTFDPQPPTPTFTKETKTETPLNGFGLLGNYYFMTREKFAAYGGVQAIIASGKGKTTTTLVNGTATVVETKNNASAFGLNMGFLYFVKNNIALNASVGLLSFNTIKSESTSPNFNNQSITTETKNSNWVFGLNGMIINIGAKIFLNKASN